MTYERPCDTRPLDVKQGYATSLDQGSAHMTDDRKAFEAWVNTERPSLWIRSLTYPDMAEVAGMDTAWLAWQAATAAALERAAQICEGERRTREFTDDFEFAIDHCINAIRAAKDKP